MGFGVEFAIRAERGREQEGLAAEGEKRERWSGEREDGESGKSHWRWRRV